MLVKLSTDKGVTEAATALQHAVQVNHFGVMQVHNLQETMTKRAWSSSMNALFLMCVILNKPRKCLSKT
jgi:hypothetical protein